MSHHQLWRNGLVHNGHLTVPRIGPNARPKLSSRVSSSRRRARSEDKTIPRFLFQSPTEIRRKFHELEDLQNERLRESLMPEGDDSEWKLDDSYEARVRNRYSNISAWEKNRIHLNVPAPHCDYINASPIVLESRSGAVKRYIATQGPKEGQFNHLWRMVWQETQDVAVIVMLTKTFELGRDKCFQYFPEDDTDGPWVVEDNGEFGDDFQATIALLEKTKHRRSSCTVRKMELKVGDRSKTVWHLLFKGWPDYNVPEGDDKLALLELIKLANAKNMGPDNPLIVHCSAGVGRSGTFITLDHFIHEIDAGYITMDERQDLVFDTVNILREQRMYMVQSQVQFEFIYQVLREKFQKRSKSASPPTSQVYLTTDEEQEVTTPETDGDDSMY